MPNWYSPIRYGPTSTRPPSMRSLVNLPPDSAGSAADEGIGDADSGRPDPDRRCAGCRVAWGNAVRPARRERRHDHALRMVADAGRLGSRMEASRLRILPVAGLVPVVDPGTGGIPGNRDRFRLAGLGLPGRLGDGYRSLFRRPRDRWAEARSLNQPEQDGG